jgi:hypothetical protein
MRRDGFYRADQGKALPSRPCPGPHPGIKGQSVPLEFAELDKHNSMGSIRRVESVTHGDVVSYEATAKMKSGKNTEVSVNADGTPHK